MPGFRLSAPHALAALGAAAHASGRGRGRRAGGAEAHELLSWHQFREEGGPPAEARFACTLHGTCCLSMASYQQSRIQAYLEKNKIGPLFEVRRCGGRGAQTKAERQEGSKNREQTSGRGAPVALVHWHCSVTARCPGTQPVGTSQVTWARTGELAGPNLSLAGEV